MEEMACQLVLGSVCFSTACLHQKAMPVVLTDVAWHDAFVVVTAHGLDLRFFRPIIFDQVRDRLIKKGRVCIQHVL